MQSGWTGGQYSAFRALLGAYVVFHVAALSDAPAALRVLAIPAGMLLSLGLLARPAALLAAAAVAWPWPRTLPALALPFVLVLHACLPPAPFGSWAARDRVDPRGEWSMTPAVRMSAWYALAGAYFVEALLRLAWLGIPVAAYALSAAFTRTPPWAWTAMLLLQALLPPEGDEATRGALLALHLFTFDPAWIPRTRAFAPETVFYDGHCGLCQRTVRFLLAEDPADSFRFGPLHGDTMQSTLSEAARTALPDSLVVRTEEGALLLRSNGVIHILRRLGGLWRFCGEALAFVPTVPRDAGYDAVARVRRLLFAPPPEACPVRPRELAARFLP